MQAVPERCPDDPRARAARTKRDRTRRALLDAADRTFGSRGWGNTRMEDVAVAAGVSAATAYNHFPTKHTLVAEVFGPLVRPLLVQAEKDVEAGRPVIDALKEQVIALSRLSARNRGLTGSFWSAVEDYTVRVGQLPDPGDPGDPRVLAPVPDALDLLIAHGQATGQLRPYPSAAEMSGMIVNILLVRSLNRPDESSEELAELLLTVLFGALKPELLTDERCGERPFRGAD